MSVPVNGTDEMDDVPNAYYVLDSFNTGAAGLSYYYFSQHDYFRTTVCNA